MSYVETAFHIIAADAEENEDEERTPSHDASKLHGDTVQRGAPR